MMTQAKRGMTMRNFQEQVTVDLDDAFFNAPAFEFVTPKRIKGVQGLVSNEHMCNVVIDRERYMEQRVSAKSENVSLAGTLFFIRTAEWMEKFKKLPKVGNQLKFDGENYLVDSVVDDMGMLEITLEATRGVGR